ncbi:unnamed protein product [Clavelina lepadiformis]|uniref:G-protein coupled receptors family 3 profile domain-containing protein n=1 Tax=Clavelina lepadiformis TaxID=159417 RepID=A0ABP0GLU7_CLALP
MTNQSVKLAVTGKTTAAILMTSLSQEIDFNGGDSELLQAVVIVLIIIGLYLATITSYYLHKHNNRRLKLSNSLLCATACVLFLQTCWFQVEVTIKHYTDAFCQAYSIVNIIVATCQRTVIYGVLWIRQRGIYKNPLQKIRGKTVEPISNGTITGIIVFAIAQVVLLSSISQLATEIPSPGCHSETITDIRDVLLPMIFGISSLFQIVLLVLTLYPMVKHMRSKTVNKKRAQLGRVATRLAICTTVCVIVDVIFLIITQTKPDDAAVNFIPICYAFNIAVNIAATLCSFFNYSLRLWPFVRVAELDDATPQPTGSQSRDNSVIFHSQASVRSNKNKLVVVVVEE